MSIVGTQAFAHDFAARNADGKTIYYCWNADGTVYVSYRGDDYSSYKNEYTGDIVIPETVIYNGWSYYVTAINNWAFYGCNDLTSVIIPNSVTNIGAYAFQNCTSLTSINVPNSMTNIGGGAFDNTAWYDNQSNGLVYIGKVAYAYKGVMPANTSLTIKEGTLGIAGAAFIFCSGLTSVAIPNSVKTIVDYAFYGCSGLTNVVIPKNVTYIGSSAFSNCTNLKTLFILSTNAPEFGSGNNPFPSNTLIYVTDTSKYTSLTNMGYTVKTISISEDTYCGTIPTLEFNCPEGISVVSYDVSTLKKNVGMYLIPVTYLANGSTYEGQAVVVITKKPLTVTAHNKTREYGEANPELTIGYDGFVAGESVAVLLTPPHAKTAADTSSPAGQYDITVDGASSNNYEIIYQKGTLTVSKAPLSVVVNNATKEYGEANPTFTCSYHGLKNGENYPAWSTAPTYRTDATASSGVGDYSVSLVNGEAKNYEIKNRTDGVLTITLASLTVTAKDVTRQYGDENPAFTFSYAGFKGSDNENTLSAKPQGTTSANKKSDVGDYAITASGASSPNYAITYKNGVLHVTQTPLTIKPYDVNRRYGENNPTFTFSYTGFKNGEGETVLDTKPTASAPGRETSVGTYTIQASGATAKNYAITHVNGTLTIGKAPLVATANNSTREYGDANPTFTATYSGFVNGETEASLASKPSFTTPATRYSDVGSYDIVPTGGSAKNYYFSEYRKGTLTITPASLLVKANNQQRLFYEENPTLTYTCVGFKNSDNSSVFTTQPQLECEATMISDAGEYPITISGAACKNYTLGYENATMTVKKRTLQVTPADATRKYGEANPKFTCTLQGFVRNQNESVIAEMPEIYTTATTTSDVGRYDILSRGGSAVNYDFNYSKKGVLTIEKADQSIVWEQDLSRIAVGEQVELQAYATSGLDIEYVFDTDIASIYRVGSKRYLDCYGIGTFVLRASQPGNNNYEAAVRVAKTVVIDSATGINDATETIGNGEPFDVYDLNGRKVRYQTTSLKDLPRGVYVVNGRKVVK